MLLQVHALSFAYDAQPIFSDIALELAPGQVVCIAGPNGTGKTTLVKCIAGILRPQHGRVVVQGTDTQQMTPRERARLLGYVPQSIAGRFAATVFETVLAGRRPHMSWRPSQADMQMAAVHLARLNLQHLAMRDMGSLSGGQAQKVMLARALAQETPCLILDEPTSSLDVRHQLEILETIRQLAREKNLGVLIIIHDLNLAARYCDQIVMLHQGAVYARGTPAQVITATTMAEVYGVEADIQHCNGSLHLHVLHALNQSDPRHYHRHGPEAMHPHPHAPEGACCHD